MKIADETEIGYAAYCDESKDTSYSTLKGKEKF